MALKVTVLLCIYLVHWEHGMPVCSLEHSEVLSDILWNRAWVTKEKHLKTKLSSGLCKARAGTLGRGAPAASNRDMWHSVGLPVIVLGFSVSRNLYIALYIFKVLGNFNKPNSTSIVVAYIVSQKARDAFPSPFYSIDDCILQTGCTCQIWLSSRLLHLLCGVCGKRAARQFLCLAVSTLR